MILKSRIANDQTKDFKQAKLHGKFIVHPEWLLQCKEQRRLVSELEFPHTHANVERKKSSSDAKKSSVSTETPARKGLNGRGTNSVSKKLANVICEEEKEEEKVEEKEKEEKVEEEKEEANFDHQSAGPSKNTRIKSLSNLADEMESKN